ncbi:hypothetical protein GW721_11970 [Citrobacter braakii]|jgi:hypothetical protein|nr:hypothetical protein [Citrobacter braakii]
MKIQKTVMVVALLSAGLMSGISSAATSSAVTWNQVKGGEQSVLWVVNKPIAFSFTVTPSDIVSVDIAGVVNLGTGGVGNYKNGPQAVVATAKGQTYTTFPGGNVNPYAVGYTMPDGTGQSSDEAMILIWAPTGGGKAHEWSKAKTGDGVETIFNKDEAGSISGILYDMSGSSPKMITNIDKVKSKSFVLKLDVSANKA